MTVFISAAIFFGAAAVSEDPALGADTGIPADRDVVIQIDEITPAAKFYPVDVEGTRMEVIAVRASDGSVRTAFNTCQVCYDSGRGYYVQEGSALVC